MVNSANLCVFEGRIAKDIDYSSFNVADGQGGQKSIDKARFSLAVDRILTQAERQKVKNGDTTVKTADFLPMEMIGAGVSVLKQYFFKGKGIRVVCHYSTWQSKNQQTGETIYGHTFEVDDFGFCIQDPKNAANGGGTGNAGSGNAGTGQQYNNSQQQSRPQQQQAAPAGFSMFDDDNQPF